MAAFQTLLGLGTGHKPTKYEEIRVHPIWLSDLLQAENDQVAGLLKQPDKQKLGSARYARFVTPRAHPRVSCVSPRVIVWASLSGVDSRYRIRQRAKSATRPAPRRSDS